MALFIFSIFLAGASNRDSAYHYLNSRDFLRSHAFAQAYLDQASSKEEAADAYILLGNLLSEMDSVQESVQNYRLAVSICEELSDSTWLPYALHGLSLSYAKVGVYDLALDCQIRANELLSSADSVTLGKNLSWMGTIYKKIKHYPDALSSFNEALNLIRGYGNHLEEYRVLSNMALFYLETDSLLQAKAIFETLLGAPTAHRSELSHSITLLNYGLFWMKTGQLDSAQYYFSQAQEIKQRLGQTSGLALLANHFGELNIQMQQYDLALRHLVEGERLSQQVGLLEALSENYWLTSQLFEARNNPAQALTYFKKHLVLKDSVTNKEKSRAIAEMQIRFETEQKETELRQARMEQAIEQQNAIRNRMIAVILAGLVFISGSLLLVVVRQRKGLKRLNADLETKNKRITILNQQNFHFTKNSLTEVVSVLNAQIRRMENHEVKTTLIAGRLRLETVNLLYNQLFAWQKGAQDQSQIEMGAFIHDIAANTLDSLLTQPELVTLRAEMEEVYLPQEKALSLGLIVNEVCINACKYAFLPGVPGALHLHLYRRANTLTLTLTDSGPGLPEGLDWQAAHSFGLQLIRVMADDLHADLYIDTRNTGLSYIFNVPISDQPT